MTEPAGDEQLTIAETLAEYEPKRISIKLNTLASPQTFGLITITTDGSEHSFYKGAPLVVDGVVITAFSTNTGTVYIGPEGNANYPLAAGKSFNSGQIDINVFRYNGAAGNKIYFIYGGAPSITSIILEESPAQRERDVI